MKLRRLLFAIVPVALVVGCSASGEDIGSTDDPGADEGEGEPQTTSESEGALTGINCSTSTATGYKSGNAFTIHVVHVSGEPVEKHTANAFYVMAKAAAHDGVNIKVVSGFRTMSEQKYLYHCYTSCSCNSCNLAAKPGYSNHQSGHALDLNTSAPGVYHWLANHGAHYGFKRTVSSEAWHWEWWGGGPGGGPCN